MERAIREWLANDAERLRAWLTEHAPALLHRIITDAPLWVLVLLAAFVVFVLIWAVREFVQHGFAGMRWATKLVTRPRQAVLEVVRPEPGATRKDIAGLETLLEQMKAQLDRLQVSQEEAGLPALTLAERERRDEAAADLVAEQSPAADAAARAIAAGDFEGAVATLERDALAASQDAAERWRRLGALARGVDTAKARQAYEAAFNLQPEDFWTCVELARLRREAGDLRASHEAALAAERVAQTERERSVSFGELGDVLVQAGDLAGAKARFEACHEVLERLAEQNPGSAQAQRDVWVSMWRLAGMAGSGVSWAQVLEKMEAMKARGVLLPTDEPFLEQARSLAAGK